MDDRKLDIINRLASGLSHNFNNQLAGITGLANLIRLKAYDSTIKKQSGDIIGICKNAGDAMQDFLSFVKHKPANVDTVNAHNVIISVVNLLSNCTNKRTEFSHKLDAEHCTILADAAELRCTLLDMALNMKDEMVNGGIITFVTESGDGVFTVEILGAGYDEDGMVCGENDVKKVKIFNLKTAVKSRA